MASNATDSYPVMNPKFPFICHGADYNPEQWPMQIWEEDMRLMKAAHINIVTLSVFSWTQLQPDENTFNFGWLDKIISMLAENDICIALATPTAAQPAWMSEKYPEVLRSDEYGRRQYHGRRVNYCPNSSVYRRFAANIAKQLAQRYKDAPNIALWHISNEYSGQCYCDNCANAFRSWLREKYDSLDLLNEKWYNRFWSHTYTDWSQITLPYKNGENLSSSLSLDYMRFMDQSMLTCFRNEADIIRQITPEIPVTTNMMSPLCKEINSRNWGPYLDVISWDSYPFPCRSNPANIAFRHNCMRGVKDGQSFMLIEQSPSNKVWSSVLSRKPPGLMRLWSYQAIAHGSESVMYFQWRRSRGGCEKLHSAIVECDNAEQTRVFREVAQLGGELQNLGDKLLGSMCNSEAAILFDWENYWAIDLCIGPLKNKCYVQTVQKHHQAFFENNIAVNVVFPGSNFDKYKVLIAPMLYMLRPGLVEKIEGFVKSGGIFITTTFSGMADENDLFFTEGFLGPLQNVMGIWVEEIDVLYDEQFNTFCFKQSQAEAKKTYKCSRVCDTIHTNGAKVLANYGQGWQAGTPVVTENTFGKGKAYYIGTEPEQSFLNDFYMHLCESVQISVPLEAPCGVEVSCRYKGGKEFIFVLNHNEQPVNIGLKEHFVDLLTGRELSGRIILENYGVKILERKISQDQVKEDLIEKTETVAG